MTTSTQNPFQRARRGVGTGGRGAGTRLPRGSNRGVQSSRGLFFLMALPSVLFIGLVNLYPLLYAASQSVHDGNLIAQGPFVGLENYVAVLTSPQFANSARFTLLFTVVGVFGSWIVGLALALLLRTRIPAGGTFKVLLLLPWVIPIVASATAWNWLIATPSSPVPVLFDAIGLDKPLFLADPVLAIITVCAFKVWVSFPFMMLMMGSALAGVDESVYEAGRMDGASRWQQLTQLTLPMISKPIYISWILMMIFCVNDFTTIYLLTGGGPVSATNSLLVYAYRLVFQDQQTGPGVAVAFLMTFVLTVVSVVLYRQIRKSSL